jgi:hypothetical protein
MMGISLESLEGRKWQISTVEVQFKRSRYVLYSRPMTDALFTNGILNKIPTTPSIALDSPSRTVILGDYLGMGVLV